MVVLPKSVDWYVRRGRATVDGWLSELDARLIAITLQNQARARITGSVGEIGVHHGKLFILLELSRAENEPSFAIDVFEEQEKNLDRSGLGDKDKFLTNLERITGRRSDVKLFQDSSDQITWSDIKSKIGCGCRFLSIDGGHTRELTLNDLMIADAALVEGGVAVLDDYFNVEFADVSVGLNDYMAIAAERQNRLMPFAIGDNKVFLYRPGNNGPTLSGLRGDLRDSYFVKTTTLFGVPTPVFRTPRTLYNRVKQSGLAKTLSNNPTFERLKPLVRRVLSK